MRHTGLRYFSMSTFRIFEDCIVSGGGHHDEQGIRHSHCGLDCPDNKTRMAAVAEQDSLSTRAARRL
jgi:hypothetical protein